jgi:DNA-binding NarL/FixJ family response regulator
LPRLKGNIVEISSQQIPLSCLPALVTGQRRIARILIVDSHPIVREGLRWIIDQARELVVCAEADTVTSALAAIEETDPDVIVMDISLNQGDGIGLVRDVRACYPKLAILVLSNHQEDLYAEHMLSVGANGYMTKDATSEQILRSLRRVIDGKTSVSDAVANNIIQGAAAKGRLTSANPVDRLSNRELQVLYGIRCGTSTREIARSLKLSVKTVESHRQRIKRKLNLRNGSHLMRFAVDWFNRQHPQGISITDVADNLRENSRSYVTGEQRHVRTGADAIAVAPRAAEFS